MLLLLLGEETVPVALCGAGTVLVEALPSVPGILPGSFRVAGSEGSRHYHRLLGILSMGPRDACPGWPGLLWRGPCPLCFWLQDLWLGGDSNQAYLGPE